MRGVGKERVSSFPPRKPSPLGRQYVGYQTELSNEITSKYFCNFYNLNFGNKGKIYVTTVLDSFQDRKGITLRVVNNKQVIGQYSMKYGRNKTKKRTRETLPLPSRVCVFLAPFHFLSPCDFHMPVTEATKMSLFCSSFRPLPWHSLFCSFLAQFYWRCPCLRK